MPRTVILPQELDEKLQALTSLREESNGVLLYRQRDNICSVRALYMTGLGSAGHVQSDSRKVEIVNRFFEKYPNYKYVKFHTHTIGTIRQYGDWYAEHFSKGDTDGYIEQLRDNSEFIAMLVTPKTKLLCGLDNPQLRVAEHSEDYERYHEAIEDMLKYTAEELGMEHERFRGTELK